MPKERPYKKPFQVFLIVFYISLCLGTFILERNDNINNAFFFFIFFLFALYGQNRTLNYNYLTGGGEKPWDKHIQKEVYFSGKSFEIKQDDQFFNERYLNVKNIKFDNVRRFFSYFMIAVYFLVLYFSGSLSHSFLNIIPFLICLTIIKITYLGHYLIPLCINIFGIGYAYSQYNLHLDFFTFFYVFLVFILLILYRKIEQQQIYYGNSFFDKTSLWDKNEKKQIIKIALFFTVLLFSLLLLFLYLVPSKWGNSSEKIAEFTQIKSQKLALLAQQYIIRPYWLKRDLSDTGAPIKELSSTNGEKISNGEKGAGHGKSLKFNNEDGRLFSKADPTGEKDKSGLKINESKDSQNEGLSSTKETQVTNQGDTKKTNNQTQDQASANVGTNSNTDPAQKNTPEKKGDTPDPMNKNDQLPSQKNNETSQADKNKSGVQSNAPGRQGENGQKEGNSGSSGMTSGGTGTDKTSELEDQKEKQNANNKITKPQLPPPKKPTNQEKFFEDDFPWIFWFFTALFILLTTLGLYFYLKNKRRIKQVNFTGSFREILRQEFERLKKTKHSPEQEIILYYNFFQKVSHHLLPSESIKLPPTIYGQLLSNEVPQIQKLIQQITSIFSDVYYGEIVVSSDTLKLYRTQIKQLLKNFHF